MRRGAKYAWRERHPASSSSTSPDDEPPASVNRRGMSAVLLPRRRSRLRPGTFQGHFADAGTCTVHQGFPPRGRLSSRSQRGAFDFWRRWFLIFSGGFVFLLSQLFFFSRIRANAELPTTSSGSSGLVFLDILFCFSYSIIAIQFSLT
jgi:hypothetical protein